MTKKKSIIRGKLFVDSGSSKQSLATELIAGNVDILTELFLRLPAESLIRFKCVSKHWLNLISDYQFACNHACQNSNSLISGIYWKSQLEKQVKSVSLHGHSCLPTLTFLNHHGDVSNDSEVSDDPKQLRCFLAFDPSKSPHFKVVVATLYYLNYHDEEQSFKILIYSSLSTSWKCVFFPSPRCIDIGPKVFCNGAIHWMCRGNIHFQFELDAEELIETPIPPKPKILDDEGIRYFRECCGRLLLIQIRKFSAEGFRILEMDTDYCGCTVKHCVDLRPIIALLTEMVQTNRWSYSIFTKKMLKFSLLSVVKEANKKDSSLLLGISGKAISFNLKTKMWKVLHDFPPKESPV